MACSCQNKTASQQQFIVSIPGKGTKTVSNEVDAAAMANRTGGTYRPAPTAA
jgi:hypothetical protein